MVAHNNRDKRRHRRQGALYCCAQLADGVARVEIDWVDQQERFAGARDRFDLGDRNLRFVQAFNYDRHISSRLDATPTMLFRHVPGGRLSRAH